MQFETGHTLRNYHVGGSFKITESGFFVEVIVYDPLWKEIFYATVPDYDTLTDLLQEEAEKLSKKGTLINVIGKNEREKANNFVDDVLITLEVMTRRE